MARLVFLTGSLLALLLFCGQAQAGAPQQLRWRNLQRGVEYAAVSTQKTTAAQYGVRDTRLHILRVDPRQARLVALIASQLKQKPRTARQWVSEHDLIAAINLGMYHDDKRTHSGYLRSGTHLNSRRWVSSYKSALAFGPRSPKLSPLLFADLGPDFDKQIFANYEVVTQNLRLIKSSDGKSGQGVWSRQAKRWSEAAVAIDRRGRLLMLFTRVPFSMWELNRFLLSLPLGIIRVMHMEGGPEASLSIHAKGLTLDLSGSYESGFWPNDSNTEQWPLPNVLGVKKD